MIPLVAQMQNPLFWVGLLCDGLPVILLGFLILQHPRPSLSRASVGVLLLWFMVDVATLAFPPGPQAMDVRESMTSFAHLQNFAVLWDNSFCTLGFHWLAPYFLNTVTGSLFGERLVGMVYHLAFILGVAVLCGNDLLVVMAALAPSVLYLSRNYGGCDILLMQLVAVAALVELRQRGALSVPLAALAGVAVALTAYDYIPSRVLLLYPALLLWQKPASWTASVYVVAATVLSPLVLLPWLRGASIWPALVNTTGHTPTTDFGWPTVTGVATSLRALVAYTGLNGTYSVTGGQVLPWTFVACLAIAAVRRPVETVGWLAIAAVSIIPDIANFQAPGRSHRQMMVLIPLFFAVRHLRVPRLVTAAVGAECLVRWVWLCFHIGSAFGTLAP